MKGRNYQKDFENKIQEAKITHKIQSEPALKDQVKGVKEKYLGKADNMKHSVLDKLAKSGRLAKEWGIGSLNREGAPAAAGGASAIANAFGGGSNSAPPPPPPPADTSIGGMVTSSLGRIGKAEDLSKDNKPHAKDSPEDKAHDVVEENEKMKQAVNALKSSNIQRMFRHLRQYKQQGRAWVRSKMNQKLGKGDVIDAKDRFGSGALQAPKDVQKLDTSKNKKTNVRKLFPGKPSKIKTGPKLEKKQGVPSGVDPAKHERCVLAVKKQGKGVNPYAVCNASLQKAGHLLGAWGKKNLSLTEKTPQMELGRTKEGAPIHYHFDARVAKDMSNGSKLEAAKHHDTLRNQFATRADAFAKAGNKPEEQKNRMLATHHATQSVKYSKAAGL
jgi:hypothetical protein